MALASMETAQDILSERFGYDHFRPGQRELIEALLEGRDALGIMATGAGKSLCYQIPGVAADGLALVISPLVSLMGDQVRSLSEAGVRAAMLNSTLAASERDEVLRSMNEGAYDVLYIAPERLTDERFLDCARSSAIALIAVDEAHCVSQWGQDFRPSYLAIADFVDSLPRRVPICALTATATPRVRSDIVRLLRLRDPFQLIAGFDRPNLRFAVERREASSKADRVIAYALAHPDDAGIVYCSTRKDVETIHELLREAGVAATRYHAGLPKQERLESQRAFVNDEASVIVATNAFGLGIDKSNVRYVLHHNMPASLEAYYQEAGRAGRDGEPAECLLLWNERDIGICRHFIEEESGARGLSFKEAETVRLTRHRLLEAMVGYCYTTDCLRAYILRYFGEHADKTCDRCANCQESLPTIDVTDEARTILRCVGELHGRFGKGVIADILRGSRAQRLRDWGLSRCRSFGKLSASAPAGSNGSKQSATATASHIREVVELLVVGGYLEVTEGRYPLVKLGPRYRYAARPTFKLTLKDERSCNGPVPLPLDDPSHESVAAAAVNARSAIDPIQEDALFESLRGLRKSIAKAIDKPPYIVFSDATLRDMCRRRPKTEEEFLAVSGVGATKLKRYGPQFLSVINDFASPSVAIAPDAAPSSSRACSPAVMTERRQVCHNDGKAVAL